MQRVTRGTRAELSGRVAEQQVAQYYIRRGGRVLAERWRSPAGEVDLIVVLAGTLVFVEVKSAQSHADAAASLSVRQQRRICAAAELFAGQWQGDVPCDMRIDVALVAGGVVEVLESAITG